MLPCINNRHVSSFCFFFTSGLEKRIRDNKAKHLFDIDGDICHHIHNATKQFCKPFENFVEKLFIDIYNDFKWSPDLRDILREICEMIGLGFTMPERFIAHRWLSCYDLALSTMRLWDAYQIFYYGFLSSSMKLTYKAVLIRLMKKHNLSQADRDKIRERHGKLTSKKLTDDGAARKKRIFEKVLYQAPKSLAILHLYKATLPLLKSYVCLFQSKTPLIHKAHDEQEKLFKNFLACYLKSEYLISFKC